MDNIALVICILIFLLIIIGVIITSGYVIFRISNKYGIMYSIGVIILVYIFLNMNFQPGVFFKDYNSKYTKLQKLTDGNWTTVYKLPNGKLLKQISAPGVSHNDFTSIYLPSLNRTCHKFACTLPVMLSHKIITHIMWKSLKRIYSGELKNVKYFAKIYEMNEAQESYIQEYVPLELTCETRPSNYKEQIIELNNILKEKDLYIDDLHTQNWRVTLDGTLKIIDCEVFTSAEKNVQSALIHFIDGNNTYQPQSYDETPYILHPNDKPCIYNICEC